MSSDKTRKRLNAAIKSVSELRDYLERTVRKIDLESSDQSPPLPQELQNWLVEQAEMWRRKRDTEPKSSEAYRFFHGKSEGIIEVLRHLEEINGKTKRGGIDRGYMSARDQSVSDQQQTASLNLLDTMSQ